MVETQVTSPSSSTLTSRLFTPVHNSSHHHAPVCSTTATTTTTTRTSYKEPELSCSPNEGSGGGGPNSLPPLTRPDAFSNTIHSSSSSPPNSNPETMGLYSEEEEESKNGGGGGPSSSSSSGVCMKTPHLSKKFTETEILEKIMGMSFEQKKRCRALSKMGVSEEDLKVAERIFLEAAALCSMSNKEERMMGYSLEQMKRCKALYRLGVTEEEIDLEASKSLGALGVSEGGGGGHKKRNSHPRSALSERATSIECGCNSGDVWSPRSSSSQFTPPPLTSSFSLPVVDSGGESKRPSTSGSDSSPTVMSSLRGLLERSKRKSFTDVSSTSATTTTTSSNHTEGHEVFMNLPTYQDLLDMLIVERRKSERLERELAGLRKQFDFTGIVVDSPSRSQATDPKLL